jgi:cytochrome P450
MISSQHFPDGSESVPTAEYDYTMPALAAAHQLELDDMRTRMPFFKDTWAQGFWVFTEANMIREAYQNAGLFSSSAVIPNDPDPDYLLIPEQLDGPLHRQWRVLLAERFGMRAVNGMEDQVRRRCVELVENFAARGHVDFLNDFARRYPTSIFMELMGLPVEETDLFLRWEHQILHLTSDEDPDRSLSRAGVDEVTRYFSELIEDRRKSPRRDLVSEMLAWEIDGKSIPPADMLGFCLLMFQAGLDTVTSQLAYSWWHLATHDEDRRRVVADPSVIPWAIEELLRYYAFVNPARKVTEDTEYHGCPLKRGDMVMLPLSAATRDPGAFPDADKVVIDRKVNNHIAFGAGPHRCLGSHLARRELKVAMEEWHKRIPEYRLPAGFEVWEHGTTMFGINDLPLEW